jgi:hypothetical protein
MICYLVKSWGQMKWQSLRIRILAPTRPDAEILIFILTQESTCTRKYLIRYWKRNIFGIIIFLFGQNLK